ncbi:hypothetical protein V0M98_32605 (plasmid) [Pseudomonas silesiensis]|uniref:hypothetical protein n=1 Tax=Pseudomonas silesiensis TaxID=1853130 RepID=UPI0030CD58F5
MLPLAIPVKTLVSVDLKFSSGKMPLAVAQIAHAKHPLYFNTHDLREIRKGLKSRQVRVEGKIMVNSSKLRIAG